MTPRSNRPIDAPDVLEGEASSPHRSPGTWVRRLLLAPAILAIAVVGAACSSSSPNPADQASTLISQGLSAEKSGHTQSALSDFNDAVSKDPANAVPYYDLGVLYQQDLNKPGLAAAEYNKALLADPNYKPAAYNLAIVETPTDPTAAITLYNELLKVKANDPNVLFNLGLLLIAQGQTTQGQADVTKAVFLAPALKSKVPKGVTP